MDDHDQCGDGVVRGADGVSSLVVVVGEQEIGGG